MKELGNSILGGYGDNSEDIILVGLVISATLLVGRRFPLTWGRWVRLGVHDRVGYILIVMHLVAYFVLPVATPTAKFIHFRHAVIAAMMLPFIVSDYDYRQSGILAKVLPVALAALTLVNSWWHLWRFEREAGEFNAVLAAIPERSNLVQLTYDSKGTIMRSHAYLHFGAYAQAQKGGVFAVSFPILFWNIPLKGRANSDMPETPKNMEWSPGRFNEYRMRYFYDTVLVRQGGGRSYGTHMHHPYELVTTAGSWKLYRRNRSEQH